MMGYTVARCDSCAVAIGGTSRIPFLIEYYDVFSILLTLKDPRNEDRKPVV